MAGLRLKGINLSETAGACAYNAQAGFLRFFSAKSRRRLSDRGLPAAAALHPHPPPLRGTLSLRSVPNAPARSYTFFSFKKRKIYNKALGCFRRVCLDNTIRVQCAAEGEIFRFTALSSLKYSSISASCRLEKTKNLPPLRSKIFAENARRWPRGAQSKTYRGILRTGQQSGRGGHSRKNALYPDCIV